MLEKLLKDWTVATADLKPGVQRVFHDVFTLAAAGETHLIYGADYHNGAPCLVNTVGGMLTTGGGMGVPMANFADVVSLFDQINAEFHKNGVNTEFREVSELAATFFLNHFAPLKEMEVSDLTPDEVPYREASDEEMAKAMVALFSSETPPPNDWEFDTEAKITDPHSDFVVIRANHDK